METALDLLPARRAEKAARQAKREASRLRSDASYLQGLCGPDDNDWLRVANRIDGIAATLEAEAGRLERVAKGLGKWAGLAFRAAPATPPETLPLPGAERWPVIEGGRADVVELATARRIVEAGEPDAA